MFFSQFCSIYFIWLGFYILKMAIKKLAAYKCSIRKRHMALRSQSRQQAMFLKRYSVLLIIQCMRFRNHPYFAFYRNFTPIVVLLYLRTAFNTDRQWNLARPLRWLNSIDSFATEDCYNFFRVQKNDLPRLLAALRFPDECKTRNRLAFSGEEIMLRGLYELVSGEDQYNIAVNVFGRDQSAQSQAFDTFVTFIYDNFLDLLTDNLEWWEQEGFMEKSNHAIVQKLSELGVEDNACNVSAFIDCNCLETAVPGAGPIGNGPRADRWHDDVQRAFYNGWKSIHGLKHQTRENAYGMCEDIYGPTSLRKNDLRLLGNSRLNGRLNALPRQWQTYGDSIYPLLTNIMSGGQHSQSWKKLRCSIEWNYSVTSYNLFKYLSHFNKLRLLSSEKISKV